MNTILRLMIAAVPLGLLPVPSLALAQPPPSTTPTATAATLPSPAPAPPASAPAPAAAAPTPPGALAPPTTNSAPAAAAPTAAPAAASPRPPPYYPMAPPPPPPKPKPTRSVIEDWNPEEPPPDGYRVRSSPNGGLLAAGITFLSVVWTSSAIGGGVAADLEDEAGIDGDGVEARDWLPLTIPVGGPFWAVYSVDASPLGAALLIADGVLQAGSIAMIVASGFALSYRAVPIPGAETALLLPAVSDDSASLSLAGAF